MQISRDEAAQALDQIDEASGHIFRLKGYHRGAPHFILWGVVWLFANSVTQFWPQHAQYVWLAGIGCGLVSSALLGVMQTRKPPSGTVPSVGRSFGRRMGMTSAVVFAFIFCLIAIAQPQSQRETNAMVSILFPFAYMCVGIWSGWRVFFIGFVAAVAILVGYFTVQEWFNLWMGVFAGGTLITGGVWLRAA